MSSHFRCLLKCDNNKDEDVNPFVCNINNNSSFSSRYWIKDYNHYSKTGLYPDNGYHHICLHPLKFYQF